jgi:large subunit ribosomal protein L31e
MAIERTYTVPLRSGFRNAPAYYRTNKAMSTLRAFLVRHMKVQDDKIKIGQHLNELLWKHGIKNPPPRVTITVKKTDDGIVTAELVGQTFKEAVKPQAKTEAPTGLKERLEAAVGKKGAKEEAPAEEGAEEPKAEEKPKKAPAKKPDVRKAPQPKQHRPGSSAHEE